MPARRRPRAPTPRPAAGRAEVPAPRPGELLRLAVDALAHDGRGIGRHEGKAVFVAGALPGEQVTCRVESNQRRYAEARLERVLTPAPQRVAPACPHFGRCGGCTLQHLALPAQRAAKGRQLLETLQRLGGVRPERVLDLPPGPAWGYRRRARLSVRRDAASRRVTLGFRAQGSHALVPLDRCPVLVPEIGSRLGALVDGLSELDLAPALREVEVSAGDDARVLLLRHAGRPSAGDRERLGLLAARLGVHLLLDPPDPGADAPTPAPRPVYRLPAFDLALAYDPGGFAQVNAEVNRDLVERVVALLDPGPGDDVLDLFCGVGNFTLPLARRAGRVVGVEGAAPLVTLARGNAQANGIANAAFHAADLEAPADPARWNAAAVRLAVLDPPRSGAAACLPWLARLPVTRLVYVSCDPATLARDAGRLVTQHGFTLAAAGTVDMFPHTAHAEALALFTR